MTTSIGYALGAGSGLDVRALVTDLANAAKAPKETLLAKREAANAGADFRPRAGQLGHRLLRRRRSPA